MTPEPTLPKRPGFAERAFYQFCRVIVVSFCRTYFPGRVIGANRLPRSGPYILAPVHRSNVDWLIVARVTKRRLRYLVKEEVWRIRSVGRLIEVLGAFPVRRSAADREALEQMLNVLAGGEPLVLFPEGTRRSGPVIEDLKEGAAYLALRAQVPIVPVGLAGTERAMPRGRKLPRPARIRIVIHDPIGPEPRALEEGSSRRVPRAAVHELTERLSGELQRALDDAEALLGAAPLGSSGKLEPPRDNRAD
jgi:1-acyl-sn-glycerol-3-phosphate acyltransferase